MKTFTSWFIGSAVVATAAPFLSAAEQQAPQPLVPLGSLSNLAAKEEKKPVVAPAPSGMMVVDWTPGSDWAKKFEKEGRRADPGTAKVAPPAAGRDKITRASKSAQVVRPTSSPAVVGNTTK